MSEESNRVPYELRGLSPKEEARKRAELWRKLEAGKITKEEYDLAVEQLHQQGNSILF